MTIVNLNDKIPGSLYFTWSEALTLPSWNITHNPSDAEIKNITNLALKLNKVRSFINKPINVSCWIRPNLAVTENLTYKNKDYNAKVSGATHSLHIVGSAIDFTVAGLSVDDTLKLLIPKLKEFELSAENNGSINNRNWIHLQDGKMKDGTYRVFNP